MKILVTGACGSIGSNLVRKLTQIYPDASIDCIDINEEGLFALSSVYKDSDQLTFICDDFGSPNLLAGLGYYDLVFHLAARKHVPLSEQHPNSAITANIVAMQSFVAAMRTRAAQVVFASSDKAVNPTNVMGASKLIAERICVAANRTTDHSVCRFKIVRFGNVLGSSGSVVPIFVHQARSKQKLTVTSTEMTRFVMSNDDAVNLLLAASSLFNRNKESILVSKMKALSILDLAKAVYIKVTNKEPPLNYDEWIQFIKPRSGEKLFEELMTDEEAGRSNLDGDLFIVNDNNVSGTSISPELYSSKLHPKLNVGEIIDLLACCKDVDVDNS